MRVDGFEFFRRRALTRFHLAHEQGESLRELLVADDSFNRLVFGERGDGVLALCAPGEVRAAELVRVGVADERLDLFQVGEARARLVVVLDDVSDKWRAHCSSPPRAEAKADYREAVSGQQSTVSFSARPGVSR